jgi:plastocyanin
MARFRYATRAPAAVAALIAGVACFSERPVTGPPNANAICGIALGSPIFGGTQALMAIRNFAYLPDTIRVTAGTTVTWVNCEPPQIDAHTATSDTDLWSSAFLPPGATYSRTFDTRGRFAFYCVPHPSMRGTIIVE